MYFLQESSGALLDWLSRHMSYVILKKLCGYLFIGCLSYYGYYHLDISYIDVDLLPGVITEIETVDA